ncbi:Serine/threonine protein phosphatase 2A 55 kDa regulatory subunit B beta isoform [Acorus calamus]|uniref:Serine/threonine protein phosphatase 2A 55 kDa regulatory subunit B beta isoform n=1 Tax=Acorus calamus TaxID=4465 RepID=A0AAV9FKQ5_ACOCL|nr:Serine/threonine protein phosphatase 2A 55 kDa regulatory subunit B beta isoform [Acorus calamus]
MSSGALEWGFSQVFGERTPGDEVHNIDIISAIEFERRGEYIATGDRGGRVVIFEKVDGQEPRSRRELEQSDYRGATIPRYAYKTEFQSHEPEIVEQKAKMVKEMELNPYVCSENALLAEKSFTTEENGSTVPNGYRLEWTNGKPNNKSPGSQGASLPVNRMSLVCWMTIFYLGQLSPDGASDGITRGSDGETYISADDLRINLWNLEVSDQCFNMKPSNMEDLIEVITSAEFHPNFCNILAYSSSRGFIRLVLI